MSLRCQFTMLNGYVTATPNQFEDLEVTVPLNDSRTAKVKLSIHDGNAAEIRPLERMMKVYFNGVLVFWGVIIKPVWDAESGTVEVNCIDPTIRLKHRHHRYGHAAVNFGYFIDGRGMKTLVESAIVTPTERRDGVPKLGILWGFDHTIHTNVTSICQRGENVWDSILTCSSAAGIGPDFEFAPLDGLGSGNHVRLNTANKIGNNRSNYIVYGFGAGPNNLTNFVYEPDGDAVRNYFVSVNPGGERGSGTAALEEDKALNFCWPSIRKYGFYQGWESSGSHDPKELLRQKSAAYVNAYAYPPKFCTITPRMNVPPYYAHSFWVGDVIRVMANKGYLSVDTVARINNVTLTQSDAAGNTTTQVSCVPDLDVELSS